MLNVLFWNTMLNEKISKNKDREERIDQIIITLVKETRCDILVLVEYNLDLLNLCNKLSIIDRDFQPGIELMQSRARLIIDKRLTAEVVRYDSDYFIYNLKTTRIEFLLAGVHFPSNLHSDNADRELTGTTLMREIKDSQRENGHENVVILGDFNSDPFESVITSAITLHAIPHSQIVEQKRKRKVQRKDYQLFYNPMWNFFGDFSIPGGTYYKNSGKSNNLYWHIYDQVLFSPNMSKFLIKESLSIMTDAGGKSLLNRNYVPNKIKYSDHLPVYFKIMEDKFDGKSVEH